MQRIYLLISILTYNSEFMSNLTPIPVSTAKSYVSNWDTIRSHHVTVNQIFEPGYNFNIAVSNLPASLLGSNGDVHGYLALTTDQTPSTNNLRLILISASEDLALYQDPNYPAEVYVTSYTNEVILGTNNPDWQHYYEMIVRWNNHYETWVIAMDDAPEGLTQAFIIPKVDLQPERSSVTDKFAYFGLKDSGPITQKIDMLFYTQIGTFTGLIPKDFTTPVPPFPNGKTGWGLLA